MLHTGLNCNGNDNCCLPNIPCTEAEGDCDTDNDCGSGLLCGHNNCPLTPWNLSSKWGVTDDCCYKPNTSKTERSLHLLAKFMTNIHWTIFMLAINLVYCYEYFFLFLSKRNCCIILHNFIWSSRTTVCCWWSLDKFTSRTFHLKETKDAMAWVGLS